MDISVTVGGETVLVCKNGKSGCRYPQSRHVYESEVISVCGVR